MSEMTKASFERYDDDFALTPVVDDLLYRDTHVNGASAIELTASVSTSLKRYRKLFELDNNCILGSTVQPLIDTTSDVDGDALDMLSNTIPSDLPYIDNMTLEELDYVMLED